MKQTIKIWNESKLPKYYFSRNTCPICGALIPEDDGYGSMEIWEKCEKDSYHYSRFMNIFSNTISIMGKTFTPTDVEKIESWLNEVGNKKYMVEISQEEYNKKPPEEIKKILFKKCKNIN